MREIKFKYGYSDGTNLFEKVFTLSDIEQGLQFDEICDSPLMKDYKIVHKRQYTKLRDKNGVEVYDGDIVNIGTKINFKVAYVMSAYVLSNNTKSVCILLEIPYRNNDIEVIGNIYENPELLDG